MSIFRRSLFVILNAVVIIGLTHCKARDTSGVKAKPTNCNTFNSDGAPESVLGDTIPFGKMPGAVIAVKTGIFGPLDKETVDYVKNNFMDVMFKRARQIVKADGNPDDLFYTVVALDARAAPSRLRPGRILSQTKGEMKDAYKRISKNYSDLTERFKSGEIEKYVLIVDDSDTLDLHKRLKLPDFGGYTVTKDLCLSKLFELPADKDNIQRDLEGRLSKIE